MYDEKALQRKGSKRDQKDERIGGWVKYGDSGVWVTMQVRSDLVD